LKWILSSYLLNARSLAQALSTFFTSRKKARARILAWNLLAIKPLTYRIHEYEGRIEARLLASNLLAINGPSNNCLYEMCGVVRSYRCPSFPMVFSEARLRATPGGSSRRANPKYKTTRFPLASWVVRGGGETQLRAVVAATISILIAGIMLAQPALAGRANTVTVCDPEDDLVKIGTGGGPNLYAPWPEGSPINQAEFLDVKEATISKVKDTFVLTMTMYCDDLLADLALPPGTQLILWGHALDTDLDGIAEFAIGVAYDGSAFFKMRYSAEGAAIDFEWSICGPTITMHIDEDMIGDPSEAKWHFIMQVQWSPPFAVGGWWNVDRMEDPSGYAVWPA
jgi:hypothetical protein